MTAVQEEHGAEPSGRAEQHQRDTHFKTDISCSKSVRKLRHLLPRMPGQGSRSHPSAGSSCSSAQDAVGKHQNSSWDRDCMPGAAAGAGAVTTKQKQQSRQKGRDGQLQNTVQVHASAGRAGPGAGQGSIVAETAPSPAPAVTTDSSRLLKDQLGSAPGAPTAAVAAATAANQHNLQQQQQHVVHMAPAAIPSATAVAALHMPSSLLLPPAGPSNQQGAQQQQQQLQLAPELGQDKCKRLAEVLLRCGKPCEASAWVQAALTTDPWSVELLLLRGRCLEAAGNVPGAFTSYMAALAHSPNHLPALMAVASLYKARGMLDEARTALQTALQVAEAAAANSSKSSNGSSRTAEVASADAAAQGAAAAAAAEGVACNCKFLDQQELRAVNGNTGGGKVGSSSSSGGNGSGGHGELAAGAAEAAAQNAATSAADQPLQVAGSTAAAAGPTVPIAALKEALAIVLTDLGTRAKTAGRLSDCESLYREALALCPTYPSAHYNLGVLASEGRRWAEALQHYKDTLALAPHHAQALCNSGVVYRELDRLDEAVAAYEAALAVAPNYLIVRNNLAVALTDLGTMLKVKGQLKAGIACYERALALMPRHADALYNLGVACAEDGQTERALFCYELTTHFNPSCAEAWNNLGVLHKEADNLERAAECYMAALNIRPNFPQSLNNLAVVLTSQGKAGEALALLHAAIAASPSYAEAHNNLGVLQRDVGAIPDALTSYERALQLVPDSRNAGQNRLLALNYIYPGEDPAVCAAHVEWGASFQAQHAKQVLPEVTPAQRDTTPGRPLRVGYVSPDLFTHSVSYFAEAPLGFHSPSRVKLYVYSCVGKPDAKTSRLQAKVLAAGGVWRDVARLSEITLAQLVRQDEIDILVELTGHTANNRLGVCAMRAAPVQVTWIGYPNSTGLSAVDYRITDEVCDPSSTQQTFAEELVRLPGCFLCYTPAADPPPVAPLPAATNGFITFGSFNNLAKITPAVLGLWARILHSIPTSRLVLKAKPFSCATARQHVAAQLEAAGVAAWRFDLLPLTAATQDHLGVYSLMDISLDTFPYAGTTTTAESLFMGVPVITLSGHCHAHNVSQSLLTAIGLADQWVAHDAEHYVQLAISHASNIAALQQVRSTLRQRMLSSRLCDAAPFVADLECAYERMWQRWVTEGGRQRPLLGLPVPQQQQQHMLVQDTSLVLQQQQRAKAMVPAALQDCTAALAAADDTGTAAIVVADRANEDGANPGSSTGGSSSSSRHISNCVEVPAARKNGKLQPAAAAAVTSSSNAEPQKSRKLSSSCDAAASVHSAVAAAAAAAAAAATVVGGSMACEVADEALHLAEVQYLDQQQAAATVVRA